MTSLTILLQLWCCAEAALLCLPQYILGPIELELVSGLLAEAPICLRGEDDAGPVHLTEGAQRYDGVHRAAAPLPSLHPCASPPTTTR